MRHTLRKSEIVRGKDNFQRIFSQGKKFETDILICYVLSALSAEAPGGSIVKVGFALKRMFKKAVDRNRVKRLMRESYRMNKEIILHHVKGDSKNLSIVFLYSPKKRTSKGLPTITDITNDMKCMLNSIIRSRF